MPTSTTAAPADRADVDRAERGPIKLHAANASRRRDLTAALRVGPVRRKVGAYPRLAMDPAQLAREVAASMDKPKEQVLDRVTDGLMDELGW
jgi:hypothetical protein